MFSAVTLTFGPLQIWYTVAAVVILCLFAGAVKSMRDDSESFYSWIIGLWCCLLFLIPISECKKTTDAQANLPDAWKPIVLRLHELPSGVEQYLGLQAIVAYYQAHPELTPLPRLNAKQVSYVIGNCDAWENSCTTVIKPFTLNNNSSLGAYLVKNVLTEEPDYRNKNE